MSGRILVVEDEPAISEAVAYALREAGYEVDEVGDGNAAVAAARDRRYDLMVLDLVLPGRARARRLPDARGRRATCRSSC